MKITISLDVTVYICICGRICR